MQTIETRDVIKAAEWLAEQVQPLLPEGYQPGRTGLCQATADAVAAASDSFWTAALREGPAFVTPRDFPWMLANSSLPLGGVSPTGSDGPQLTQLTGDALRTKSAGKSASKAISGLREECHF